MKNKVKIIDKKSVVVSPECQFGENVVVHENVVLVGECKLGDGVEIFGSTRIENCEIGAGTKIVASMLEKSVIGANNNIGPFSRIRPKTKTGDGVRIGNFVEIKNSSIGNGSKIAHLAYVGDADVGAGVNIGCGAIFVNYNGKTKSRIRVKDGAFIGSNCNLIAPLTIGENSYICAGTTVTESTEKEDFVIGRVKPTVKSKRAKKYLNRD